MAYSDPEHRTCPVVADTIDGFALAGGMLDDAARCLESGEVDQARHACAEVILDHLACLAADPDLLARLVDVLLRARAHGLLGRALQATTGCSAQRLPDGLAELQAFRAAGPVDGSLDPAARGRNFAGAGRDRGRRLVEWARRDAALVRKAA